MAMPIFSVIIPTLNEEECLGRLLENLVSQTEKNFEVIVVDGGSSDRTLTVANSYKRRLPISVITSPVKNVCIQRNSGAQKSRSDWLVFFDADVQIPTRFLQSVRKQIVRRDGGFVTTYLRSDSPVIYDLAIAAIYSICLEMALFLEKPFVPGFNFIVAKDVFEQAGGFRKEIVHGEDYDLSVRLAEAGYRLKIFRSPKLTFSLRRYRTEGRLAVIRKNAMATLHIFTKGQITRNIFDYPMGGGWYKTFKKESQEPAGLQKARRLARRLIKFFLEY